jgi:hypothetical protein
MKTYIVTAPPSSRYIVVAESVADAKEEAWIKRRLSVRHGVGNKISKAEFMKRAEAREW